MLVLPFIFNTFTEKQAQWFYKDFILKNNITYPVMTALLVNYQSIVTINQFHMPTIEQCYNSK